MVSFFWFLDNPPGGNFCITSGMVHTLWLKVHVTDPHRTGAGERGIFKSGTSQTVGPFRPIKERTGAGPVLGQGYWCRTRGAAVGLELLEDSGSHFVYQNVADVEMRFGPVRRLPVLCVKQLCQSLEARVHVHSGVCSRGRP